MNDLRRSALLAVVALAAGSQPALAQRPTCYTIQPGDTAASLALRFAGDADERHQSWFQIFDPAASRFIAKARYDDIRPGWLACMLSAHGAPQQSSVRTVATGPSPSVLSDIAEMLAGTRSDAGWYVVILMLTMPFAWRFADRRWKLRRAVIEEMTQFGETFIREFERPLIHPSTSSPAMRSRLRLKPNRGRLDVLLAPGAGRRYPNLLDHRRNVEYDMERVLEQLRNQPFVSASPHQQGQWVVVPFRVKQSQKMGGNA